MANTERLYKIERLIRLRGVVSMATLLQELEVSRATLKRDLEYLRSRLGAPIEYCASERGYRFAPGAGRAPVATRHELPGLWFDEAELYSLLMAHQLLEGLDEDGLLARHLQPLLARIHELLGRREDRGAALLDRVRVVGSMRRAVPSRHFQRVAEALMGRRQLHLHYRTRTRRASGERSVSPQRLVHYRGAWYLDAWCHRAEGLRRFALDAIEDARLLDEPARELPLAEVQEAMDAGYGVFAGVRPARRWARLRFEANAAQWASHEQWHPEQQGHWTPEGDYELRLPYVDATELVMDVLRQGEQVEVLEPPALRADVQRRLAAALARYA